MQRALLGRPFPRSCAFLVGRDSAMPAISIATTIRRGTGNQICISPPSSVLNLLLPDKQQPAALLGRGADDQLIGKYIQLSRKKQSLWRVIQKLERTCFATAHPFVSYFALV